MRNYNHKSAFVPPNSTNSFKKSTRQYPEPKSLLKNQSFKSLKQINHTMKDQSVQNHVNIQPIFQHGNLKTKYHFSIQNSFPITDWKSKTIINDPTCAWFKQIQRPPLKKKHYIRFFKSEYILSNWTDDYFPKNIYLCADGMIGFYDSKSKWTDRLLVMNLKEITSVIDQSVVRTYELRYSNEQQQKWQIPSQMTHLKFTIKVDDQDQSLQLPLPNPMTVYFELSYQ